MKNKLRMLSIVYFVGIVLLVVSGLQPMNWMVYVGILLGILGLLYTLIIKSHKQE